jgi:NitT/TauT family transport system ATP-binding protein
MAGRVLVMTPGPGRLAYEAAIEAPLPRPAGFRATALFREAVERVSGALQQAMAA